MGFNVKIGSSYPDTQRALVKLYVDGELKDSRDIDVGTSVFSVSLHWSAVAGEHSYEVKLYRLVNGQESLVDSWSGSLNVARDPDGLYAWLEVVPNPVKVDGTVNVKVRIENHNSNKCFYQGTIEVVNDQGLILWPKKDYSVAGPMTYPCEIFEFDYTINGRTLTIGHNRTMVQNFTLEHVSKNMTLHLIIGGVEMASARINVVQPGPVIASMDCSPAVVPLDGSTTCTVHLKLKSADTVTLNLEEVDFGGKRVWPNGPSSVTVNKQTVTLTPTNMQEDLTVTITINDELADYYFGERPWDPIDRYVFKESFKDRFAGYTYLVTVKFDNEVSISDTFEIVTPSGLKELAKTVKSAKAIISELIRGKVSTSEGVSALVTSGKILTKAGIKGTGKFLWGIGNFLLVVTDVHDWFFAPTPSDGDSNNIVGG